MRPAPKWWSSNFHQHTFIFSLRSYHKVTRRVNFPTFKGECLYGFNIRIDCKDKKIFSLDSTICVRCQQRPNTLSKIMGNLEPFSNFRYWHWLDCSEEMAKEMKKMLHGLGWAWVCSLTDIHYSQLQIRGPFWLWKQSSFSSRPDSCWNKWYSHL